MAFILDRESCGLDCITILIISFFLLWQLFPGLFSSCLQPASSASPGYPCLFLSWLQQLNDLFPVSPARLLPPPRRSCSASSRSRSPRRHRLHPRRPLSRHPSRSRHSGTVP